MSILELHLLGEFKVIRDGVEQPLPPSKKTRALLAYLAVNQRKIPRQHLCELLWELPDDPRASLRWSLTKIRRLVDEPAVRRIDASRTHVLLDAVNMRVDSLELLRLTEADLESVSLDRLTEAARNLGGEFLESLDLGNSSDFDVWCLAERERLYRAKELLLGEIVVRLRDQPEDCLEFALQQVALRPFDLSYRINLIEMLCACGRMEEAEQQLQRGIELFRSIDADGIDLQQAYLNARRRARRLEAGSAEPVQPSQNHPGSAVSASRICKRLLGRDAEIEAMADAVSSVIHERAARCLLLKGEPGIGKSTLLDCALQLANLHKATILRATAFESDFDRPFALWSDAFRNSTHADVAESLHEGEEIDRDGIIRCISKMISAQPQGGLVMIVFDDVQWSDEFSTTALHYILRMHSDRPLCVVMAAREKELKHNQPMVRALRGMQQDKIAASVTVSPLDPTVVSELVGAEAPAEDVRVISQNSRGNPQLARALARAAAAGEVIESLSELVAERLGRMRPETVCLLDWASVLSPNLNMGSLLRYTQFGDDALECALEEAEESGLLCSTESDFSFSHELIARALYMRISQIRRQSMHRRIAESLGADATTDLRISSELARHAERSGDALLASDSLLQAARLSLRFYENDDAYAQARRGIKFTERLSAGDRIRLGLQLKEVLLTAAPVSDWETEVETCIGLAEAALDHGELASARLGYQMASKIRWSQGHWAAAKNSILQAERVSRGGSEENHVIGLAEAARCLLLLEKDLPGADALIMEADARARRHHVVSDALPAAKGMLFYYENKLTKAEELLDEARTRAKALGNRLNEFQANEYLAMIAIEKGDFVAASSRCEKLEDIGKKLRRGSEGPFAESLSAICEYALNGSSASLACSLQQLRQLDAKQRLTYALNRAALIDLNRGDWESAIVRATEALENAKLMERMSEMITAHAILAEATHALVDKTACEFHLNVLLKGFRTGGAQWARDRVQRLLDVIKGENFGEYLTGA